VRRKAHGFSTIKGKKIPRNEQLSGSAKREKRLKNEGFLDENPRKNAGSLVKEGGKFKSGVCQ